MNKAKSDYQSYLLRLWRVNDAQNPHRAEEEPVWRASLQSSLTGRRMNFPSLNHLVGFLRQQTDVGADAATEDFDAYVRREIGSIPPTPPAYRTTPTFVKGMDEEAAIVSAAQTSEVLKTSEVFNGRKGG